MKDLRSVVAVACLIMLACFVVSGQSMAAPYEIPFKSGTVVPPEGVYDIPQTVSYASQFDRAHVVLQMNTNLHKGQRQTLENAGIKLLTYLPDRAYVASVPQSMDAKTLKDLGVRSVVPMRAEYKLNPRVVEETFGRWSVYQTSKRIFSVDIMTDVSLDLATELVTEQSGFVGGRIAATHTLLVAIEPEKIATVAASDFVLYIDEISPPMDELNSTVRTRLHVNEVQNAPYNLSGNGVTVMVYDGAMIDSTHPDLVGRVTWVEPGLYSEHPTHVSGTLGGNGHSRADSLYRGMAPQVRIISGSYYTTINPIFYNNPGDFEVNYTRARQVFDIEATTNSIGANISPNGYDCSWFGDYEGTARLLDEMVRNTVDRPLIMFFAAGNERNDGGCNNSSYRCMSIPSSAKNIITVGATSQADVTSVFSSWGPTDDGRVKPEICATGENVMSCDSGTTHGYTTMSGTSMACPATAGVGSLILQQWHLLFPGSGDPLPETMKAMLINSANDLGTTGPDFQTGYGLVNARRATDNLRLGGVIESILEIDENFSHSFTVAAATAALDVSLAWSDIAATGNITPTLVNNLDLDLVDPNGVVYRPWILNPATPGNAATTGIDNVNICERVHVNNPMAGQWTLHVTGTINAGESQTFGIAANVALVTGWVNLSGQILNSANGQGIAGKVSIDGSVQTVLTNNAGNYAFTIPGNMTHDLRAVAYGFQPSVIPVTFETGPYTQNFSLDPAQSGTVSGVVRNQFNTLLENTLIHVSFPNATIPDDTTLANGTYAMQLPGANEYIVTADYYGFVDHDTLVIPQTGAVVNDFVLNDPRFEPAGPDSYGYYAYDIMDPTLGAEYNWMEISPAAGGPGTAVTGTGNDWVTIVNLPFTIRYYGQQSTQIRVSADGWVGMVTGDNGTRTYANTSIPTAAVPNGMVAAFWDDLRPGTDPNGSGDISWYHDVANGRFIVEYHGVSHFTPTTNHVTCQVIIYDIATRPTMTNDNEIDVQWQQMDYSDNTNGVDADATIGIESPDGDMGLMIVYDGTYDGRTFPVGAGRAIRFTTGSVVGMGTVQGQLTMIPVPTNITTTTIAFGSYTTHPNATGFYSVPNVVATNYSMTVTLAGYEVGQANNLVVGPDSTVQLDFTLYKLDPPRTLNGVFDRAVPEIRLTWSRPAWLTAMDDNHGRDGNALDALTGYEVWLGVTGRVATVTDTAYSYAVTTSRAYNFWIKAVYAGGLSDTSNHYRISVDLRANPRHSGIPTEFYVEQNYPNPFNPETFIDYGLPKSADVKLEIFNVLGQKVAVLHDGWQEPGNYSQKFDAKLLGSGIYYYRIEAGSFTQMRKMLLLR